MTTKLPQSTLDRVAKIFRDDKDVVALINAEKQRLMECATAENATETERESARNKLWGLNAINKKLRGNK